MPEGWKVVALGDITVDQRIGTTRRGMNGGASLPLLKMGNVLWGGLDLANIEPIDEAYALADGAILEAGDILFNTRNTPELVGKTAFWPAPFDAAFDNNLMRIRLNSTVDSRLVAAWMGSAVGQSAIGQFVCASTSVGAVYWRDLSNLEVPLPPLTEQRLIAEVLDTWDDAINTAAAIAAKYSIIYRETVLASVRGAKSCHLEDVADIQPCDSSLGIKDVMRSGSPMFTAGGVAGLYEPARHTGAAVILSAIGAQCGKCFFADGRWTAGANTVVIAARQPWARFLYHYLEIVRPWLIQGSGQPYISPANARRTPVPDIDDADVTRVAATLDALSSASEQASGRLYALRRQKRGLMQKLLSGEWRLPLVGRAFAPSAADQLEDSE